MSAEAKVKVRTIGGDEHDIETPLDIRTEDFVRELTIALNLPMTDAGNHPIDWQVDDKDTGDRLDYDRTLEDNGVRDGHRLMLIRQTTAGTAAHRSTL
ncbi:MAG TPA: EsaB/YukD family protein [Pyrinomonadaceae bacterium]|nr:EsaB/YukD family protein [Pyrinomonadaceae bacterium]